MKKNKTSHAGTGERAYWNLDRFMKQAESKAGNTISATGAIYAIRRSLFQTVQEGVTDDFVTSTGVIEQGYRLVFAPDAVAFEPVAVASSIEFGRKVRVITRGLRAVFNTRSRLLNPFQYGFYAIQLFSHKVMRRLVVYPLLILLIVTPLLWEAGWLYQLAMIGQLAFYSFAFIGMLLDGTRFRRLKFFTIPFYFCLVNAAALIASLNVLRGRQIKRWEPQREAESL
jgi:cellulose synthase/poly-beta-1,6-N-acetylglucosamine synthase-like glycosyltransferase